MESSAHSERFVNIQWHIFDTYLHTRANESGILDYIRSYISDIKEIDEPITLISQHQQWINYYKNVTFKEYWVEFNKSLIELLRKDNRNTQKVNNKTITKTAPRKNTNMANEMQHRNTQNNIIYVELLSKTIRALSYTRNKVAHSATQLSLLVSAWRSGHFHAQRPRCVSRKCACAHLCACGSVGLKMGCGQAHCWCIAILRQQKVWIMRPLNSRKILHHWPTKTWSKIDGAVFSCYLKGASDSDSKMHLEFMLCPKHSYD